MHQTLLEKALLLFFPCLRDKLHIFIRFFWNLHKFFVCIIVRINPIKNKKALLKCWFSLSLSLSLSLSYAIKLTFFLSKSVETCADCLCHCKNLSYEKWRQSDKHHGKMAHLFYLFISRLRDKVQISFETLCYIKFTFHLIRYSVSPYVLNIYYKS